MDIKEEYKKVSTPEELLEFMNKYINYGFVAENKTYDDWSSDGEFQQACRSIWKLASPEKLLNTGYGHCWDQVELERDWFSKHNYEFKTIFIWFLLDYDNNYITHTYLVYKDKDDSSWNYFEHADRNNVGIYKFDDYYSAIKFQRQKHIDFNKQVGNKIDDEILNHLHIYEYEHPAYGSNMNEFLNNIFISNEITEKVCGGANGKKDKSL